MQSFDLPHHLLIMDEIQLMKVVEVIQEELHVPCRFGQNQPAFFFCYSIMMHKLVQSAVRNRIALNIAKAKCHVSPPFTTTIPINPRPLTASIPPLRCAT